MNRYIKDRVIFHYHDLLRRRGHFYGIYSTISKILRIEERAIIDRRFVRHTILTFNACGNVYRNKKGLGRPKRLMNNMQIREIIDGCLKENDEITAKQIKNRLDRRGFYISIATINRIKRDLGWTLKGTSYCQLIRNANKPKRVQWVTENINDSFNDVIWTDETSVWLEQHSKRSYRRKGVARKRKPKPKYPLKLHVWAGISRKGCTDVCIFKGVMDAALYIRILENTLLPFIGEQYPDQHRFMQDNDPKHRSNKAKTFFEDNNINWWKTPAGKLISYQIQQWSRKKIFV